MVAGSPEEDVNLLKLASMRDQLQNMAAVNYDDINSEFVTTRKRGGRKEARQKLIAEAKPKEVINDAIKGYKARKEARQLKEQKQLKDEEAQLKRELRERLVAAGWRKDTKTEAEVNAEIKTLLQQKKAGVTLSGALKGHNARKEARKLQEGKRIDKLDEDIRKKREQQEQAGKVITTAAKRYRANKEKKALEKKIKEALEAEIDALGFIKLQKEPTTSERKKSERIKKSMESLKDFWLADTTKEAAKQAKKDVRQAKKKAQQEAEDRIGVKSQALRDKRLLLESQVSKK